MTTKTKKEGITIFIKNWQNKPILKYELKNKKNDETNPFCKKLYICETNPFYCSAMKGMMLCGISAIFDYFFLGVGNPEITNARKINNPPKARCAIIFSPPIVQANIAAKTGSSAKINDTRNGDLIFCAVIWITNADKVGKRARNNIIHSALDVTISNGRENSKAVITLKIPTIRNWWQLKRYGSRPRFIFLSTYRICRA